MAGPEGTKCGVFINFYPKDELKYQIYEARPGGKSRSVPSGGEGEMIDTG